jgi:hypothetical protein
MEESLSDPQLRKRLRRIRLREESLSGPQLRKRLRRIRLREERRETRDRLMHGAVLGIAATLGLLIAVRRGNGLPPLAR